MGAQFEIVDADGRRLRAPIVGDVLSPQVSGGFASVAAPPGRLGHRLGVLGDQLRGLFGLLIGELAHQLGRFWVHAIHDMLAASALAAVRLARSRLR